jgi:hypothetical protein
MRRIFLAVRACVAGIGLVLAQPSFAAPAPPPVPLISQGHPAQWVFAYKMNASTPTRSSDTAAGRACPFGGTLRHDTFSQQYVFASDAHPQLQPGPGLLGTGTGDPLGATFAEIFNGSYFYVLWNDQFQRPAPANDHQSPWGHSKGILAWNENGDGIIVQVTTPAWPGSGSAHAPAASYGNTLGCLSNPIRNNLVHAQHFFALRLSPHDVELVLGALYNASVYAVVNPHAPQLASIGGPASIQTLARHLGTQTSSRTVLDTMLSSGVRLISKPSGLQVPPWQLVSAVLAQSGAGNGPDLRAATWWAAPQIPTTVSGGDPGCWGFNQHPGAVAIATTGQNGMNLTGGGAYGNHAKIGVSVSGARPFTIFGDLNQQGALSGNCGSSQNGRGGLFFVLENQALHDSVAVLIGGDTAPAAAAPRTAAGGH